MKLIGAFIRWWTHDVEKIHLCGGNGGPCRYCGRSEWRNGYRMALIGFFNEPWWYPSPRGEEKRLDPFNR